LSLLYICAFLIIEQAGAFKWNVVCSNLRLEPIQSLVIRARCSSTGENQGPVEIDLRHAMTPEDEKVVICRVNYVVVLHLRQVWELSLIGVPQDARMNEAEVRVKLSVHSRLLI